MKIKSSVDLIQAISDDFTWRKREIETLKDMLDEENKKPNTRRNKHKINCLIKSIVCISYSHWEGFVKTSTKYYLEYIEFLALDNTKLANNLKASFTAFLRTGLSLHPRIQQYRELFSRPSHKLPIPIDELANTHDNLKYDYFEELCMNIDFDYSSFTTKQVFIDNELLKYRNKFAHGEQNHEVDYGGASAIASETLTLIQFFRNEIENMVAMKKYHI